jgi:actin-like ATPase involved in cell morphogenesis
VSYQLGIDLGTTWTAAAILRDGRASMVDLSQRSTAVPSVVLLREDDSILVGEAADRRATSEPSRVARQFKRRIGDSTPILLGGAPHSAEAVTARLLRWVIDEVSTREGEPPESLVLTHPANWGEYKLDLLRQAVMLATIDVPVHLLSEPEAAVIHYASQERVEPGTLIGVYDLGGGTFDAAVLRKTDDGFEFLADPEGIERLGGIDFDEAVFQLVVRSIGLDLSELDEDDPALEAALQRLRAECIIAKETLSTDADTSIPVMLPSVQTEVRITRAEFESMLRPTLADSLNVTERAFQSAGVAADEIDRILLVGGSSRIPLVAELLAARFGRPIAVDAHPKNAIALGAALAADALSGATPAATSPAATTAAAVAAPPENSAPAAPVPTPVEPPPADHEDAAAVADPSGAGDPPGASEPRSRTPLIAGLAAAVIAVIVVAAVVLAGGDDSNPSAAATDESQPTDDTVAPTAPPETSSTTTTTSSTTTTTTEAPVQDGFYEGVRCAAVTDLCADITDVSLQDGELLIEWDATFVPNLNDRNHVHFFWSTFSPLQAGGGGGGDWEISDSQPHLAGTNGEAILTVNRPDKANICVTVANPDHTVRDAAIYQCWEYPAQAG